MIIDTLISIARRIGRWILERLLVRGALRLAHYMEERVVVFRARLARAKTDRRRVWLRGRIRRWTAAAKWLLEYRFEVGSCVVHEADDLLARAKGLPRVAPCERMK